MTAFEEPPTTTPVTDQTAIVTGGGRGIGRAIAIELARRGARVALVARTDDQLGATVGAIIDIGGTAIAVPADVTDEGAVNEAARTIEARLGPVDLLVNGAGRSGAVGPTWDGDADTWWTDVRVNLQGPYLWSRAVLPAMIERGRGRIVNIVSNSALAPHPFNSAYACSKAALAHFTSSLAAEIGPHGLQAFALSPGSVKTELSSGVTESVAGQKWLRDLHGSLAARWTTPDHAARAVAFLATGAADGLTGRFVHAVDDDIEALAASADEVRADDALRLALRPFEPRS